MFLKGLRFRALELEGFECFEGSGLRILYGTRREKVNSVKSTSSINHII